MLMKAHCAVYKNQSMYFTFYFSLAGNYAVFAEHRINRTGTVILTDKIYFLNRNRILAKLMFVHFVLVPMNGLHH